MTSRLLPRLLLLPLLPLALSSCGEPASEPPAPARAGAPSRLLASEPAGAVPVLEALSRPVGETVTVVGRLQKKHATLASFRLTDDKVQDCLRCGMPGGCKTPWDYCCHKDEMLKSSLTAELRDAAGRPVPVEGWDIRELDLVVVRGVLAKGDGSRPLLLIQDGWFRRERPDVPDGLKWP